MSRQLQERTPGGRDFQILDVSSFRRYKVHQHVRKGSAIQLPSDGVK